jgi:hypothetical protein
MTEQKTPRLRRRLGELGEEALDAIADDAEVGVKCRCKRGCRASQPFTA